MQASKFPFCIILLLLILLQSCNDQPNTPEPGDKYSNQRIYTNAWPECAISYPHNWQIKNEDYPFTACASEGFPFIILFIYPNMNLPLEYTSRCFVHLLAQVFEGKNISVVSDRETELSNGIPAREVEIEWTDKSGMKQNRFYLSVKKEDIWINVGIVNNKGRISEELKEIAISLF